LEDLRTLGVINLLIFVNSLGFEEHLGGGRRREKKEVDNNKLYEILGVDKKATPG